MTPTTFYFVRFYRQAADNSVSETDFWTTNSSLGPDRGPMITVDGGAYLSWWYSYLYPVNNIESIPSDALFTNSFDPVEGLKSRNLSTIAGSSPLFDEAGLARLNTMQYVGAAVFAVGFVARLSPFTALPGAVLMTVGAGMVGVGTAREAADSLKNQLNSFTAQSIDYLSDLPLKGKELSYDFATKDINGLIDNGYYTYHNYKTLVSGSSPADNYNEFGWKSGSNPNLFFSTNGYLAANQDVAKAGINPLEHFDQFGWKEGRDPSAAFDNELYLARNGDVKAAGMDPLAHYLHFGLAEGRQAYAAVGNAGDLAKHEGFDAQYYLLANADVAKAALAAGGDTFNFAHQHFDAHGWKEGRNPNAIFDTKGYLDAYKDVAAAGINPLDHFHDSGWKEGRDAAPDFDTKAYLAANADVKAVGVDPLLHYLQNGALEGRLAFNDGHFG